MDKMQLSYNSTASIKYSGVTGRPKTERHMTETSSQINSPLFSPGYRKSNETHPLTYLDISLSKQHYSYGRGYADMKAKNIKNRKEDETAKQNMEHSKVIVFKNLQQFEVNIQSQKAKLEKVQSSMKAYAVATFKGVNNSVNTHQISAHLGDITAFTIFEGYDGSLASTTLKKLYNLKLLQYFRKKRASSKEDSFQTAEQSIRYAITKSQEQLQSMQRETGDNSGSSLLSVVVHRDVVFGANCGPGSILCLTIGGQLLSLAQPHTTSNEGEVDRIVREGGRLYQTIVNIPYKQNMTVKGPMRVYPSGLIFTRTLGKSISNSKQSKSIRNHSQTKGVISVPQIQYVPASEVRWLIVLSSKIPELVKKTRIRDIIDQQMAKRSSVYQDCLAAQHVCKRILLQTVESGATQSLSVLLLIVNEKPLYKQDQKKKESPKMNVITEHSQPSLSHKPRSLKYIGKRVNFVDEC